MQQLANVLKECSQLIKAWFVLLTWIAQPQMLTSTHHVSVGIMLKDSSIVTSKVETQNGLMHSQPLALIIQVPSIVIRLKVSVPVMGM